MDSVSTRIAVGLAIVMSLFIGCASAPSGEEVPAAEAAETPAAEAAETPAAEAAETPAAEAAEATGQLCQTLGQVVAACGSGYVGKVCPQFAPAGACNCYDCPGGTLCLTYAEVLSACGQGYIDEICPGVSQAGISLSADATACNCYNC